MTHEREHERSPSDQREPARDSDVAPGRTSRTATMTGPTAPMVSGLIMRKGARDGAAGDGAEHAVAHAAGTSGHALPGELRERFESSLGTDLSGVRVHTDAASHTAADAVGAKAYAVGNQVHFAAGQYDPGSTTGQELIAHEVAHTVQQRGGAPSRQHKLAVSHAGDALEVEADRAATAMVAGAPATVTGGGGGVIARKGDDEPKGAKEEAAEAAEKKGGGDASAAPTFDGKTIGQKISFSYKTPKIPMAKLKCEAQAEVKVTGNVTLSPTSDAADAPQPTAAEAGAAGAELAKQHADATSKPEGFIEDYELEVFEKKVTPGKDKGKAEGGIAPTLKLKTRGGGELSLGVTVLKLEQKTGEGIKVEVGTITAKESIPLYKIPEDTRWKGFKVGGGLKLDFTFTIKPDKAAIAAELVAKYGPQLLGKALSNAAQVGARGIAEIMGSLPALAGIAGGYITIKSTLASLQDAQDIKHVAAAAERAVYGYAGGFSAAAGGKDVAGDPAWHASGAADGARMLTEQVGKVHELMKARAAAEGFEPLSTDEIRAAILERAGHGGSEVYDAVYAGSFNRIKEAYVKAWHDNLSTWQKLLTNTDGDEKYLRTRMGVAKKPGDGKTPAAAMPEGADTGLPPPEAEKED